MEKQVKPSYAFGPFHLDSTKRQLMREGAVVPLTPKVIETLLYLVENSDRVVEPAQKAAALLLVSALLAAALYFLLAREKDPSQSIATVRSLAALPFKPLTGS